MPPCQEKSAPTVTLDGARVSAALRNVGPRPVLVGRVLKINRQPTTAVLVWSMGASCVEDGHNHVSGSGPLRLFSSL